MNCLPFQMQNLFLIILYSICGSHRIHIQEYAYYTVWSQLFSEVHYLHVVTVRKLLCISFYW